ncbi:MAG TPA: FAD-dependent monooxygenase, partial [Mycobacteriales bacterium]
WRRGRVLIAGDAAHQMPPFAGQGLAAGVRDVANLAWKLDLVLAGRAGEEILDSYPSERLAHLRIAMTVSVELGRVICVLDPEAAATRDAGMLAARAGGAQAVQPPPQPGLGEGLILAGDPLAGQPFPQGLVGPDRRRFDDVVAARPLLVAMGDLPGAVPDRLAEVNLARVGDPDGFYARWFGEHGRGVVLVRPDRYVFGSASDAGGAVELARRWNTALGAG